jgi:hypothetical protein
MSLGEKWPKTYPNQFCVKIDFELFSAEKVAQKFLIKTCPKNTIAQKAKENWCYDFLKHFHQKIGEKLSFLTQNKAKLCKIWIITLVYVINAVFSPKMGKNRRKL